MPGKILGLDVNRDYITAVQVTSGLKGYHVTSCFRIMIEDDGGLDNALRELSRKMDLKNDTCIASIPEDEVSYRNLKMPFRETKKIRQILPFEIETVVPFPIDSLVFDFNIIDRPDQREVLAASIRKPFIAEYLSRLQAFGIVPDQIEIRPVATALWLLGQEETPENGLFLDIGLERNTLVLFLKKQIVLIRNIVLKDEVLSRPMADSKNTMLQDTLSADQIEACLESLCAKVQNTIHSFGWQTKRKITFDKVFFSGIGSIYSGTGELIKGFLGIPSEQISISGDKRVRVDHHISQVWNPALMDGALALALRDSRKKQGFNFRKDEFEVKKRHQGIRKEVKKIAAFLIIIFLLLSLDMGLDYYLLKNRYEMLNQRCIEQFRKTFPDVKRVVNPVHQMKIKIDEMKSSSGIVPGGIKAETKVLDLLKEISLRAPKTMDIDVTSMLIDPETVRIKGETDTFNTVDTFKSKLEISRFFNGVTISSANLDRTGKKVRFEIKLQKSINP